MKNKIELLPCPFCGATKKISLPPIGSAPALQLKHLPDEEFAVACAGCGTTGPIEIGKEEALRLWNKRSFPALPGK